MPTVEAIRKVTIQASTPGVDQSAAALDNLAAAQNRVALSANQLQVSMASAQKLIDDNVQKLQALRSANDNVGSSYTDLIGKARDVSGSFSETVENILNTINHLKLLAVAAYAMSPALRSIVNADVAKALGLIPPVALQAGKSFLSFAAPALSFFGRIAAPIGVAVVAWKGLNAIIDQGSALLQKYGSYERSLYGSNVDADLAKLTKFQGNDGTSLAQQQYATELATRLAAAKQEMTDMVGVQFNLTDAALRFQAIWVSIAEAIGRAAGWINSVNITMADIGNSSVFKWLNSIHIPGIPGLGSLPGAIQPGPNGQIGAAPDDTAASLAVARARLAAGMDVAASNEAKTGKYQFRTFTGMFSDDMDQLANPPSPTKASSGPNAYDRQVESIKNEITQLDLEAAGASKTSQAIQELKTAHDLNDAAMKANIPVTQQMREQWKQYADTIAQLNLQIKEQKSVQDEQFKGQTMFMAPAQSAAAGAAHAIDPNDWQSHMNDAGPQMAALNQQLDTARDLAVSFGTSFASGMMQARNGTQVLISAVSMLENTLMQVAVKAGVNSIFSLFQPGGQSPAPGQPLNILPTLPSAHGNIFYNGAPMPFAAGGIVTSPVVFPMANGGVGLAGEAGPEAIMPLARGPDGNLGVRGAGGGTNVSVTVNNNHSSAGVGIQQQQRADGGVDIVATITDAMDRHAASGGFDGVMRSRYAIPLRARPR